jgi:hypothetical protein
VPDLEGSPGFKGSMSGQEGFLGHGNPGDARVYATDPFGRVVEVIEISTPSESVMDEDSSERESSEEGRLDAREDPEQVKGSGEAHVLQHSRGGAGEQAGAEAGMVGAGELAVPEGGSGGEQAMAEEDELPWVKCDSCCKRRQVSPEVFAQISQPDGTVCLSPSAVLVRLAGRLAGVGKYI